MYTKSHLDRKKVFKQQESRFSKPTQAGIFDPREGDVAGPPVEFRRGLEDGADVALAPGPEVIFEDICGRIVRIRGAADPRIARA